MKTTNSITLTHDNTILQWELSQDELNNLLSDLADDLAYGKLPKGKSKLRVKIVSEIIGIIINCPVTEFCYRTISEYIKSKNFPRVERKRGRPKREVKYYSTMDDVEQAGICSGGEIQWRPMES